MLQQIFRSRTTANNASDRNMEQRSIFGMRIYKSRTTKRIRTESFLEFVGNSVKHGLTWVKPDRLFAQSWAMNH